MGWASENLVHWTSYIRFVPLGRVEEGRSSRKIRKAKLTILDIEILNIVWLALHGANWARPVKTWYTGPLISGLYHWGGWGRVEVAVRSEEQNLLYWGLRFEHGFTGLTVGQMGQASENLVHWTSYIRFVPLGRVGEGQVAVDQKSKIYYAGD